MRFRPGPNVTLRVIASVAAGSVSRSSLQISTKARILLHFVPRFGREKGGGGEPGHYSCLSVHLASAGQLLRQKEKPSLVFFHSPLFSAFLFLFFFLFWRQISRIKYGSHMLLLTIGIHHGIGPTATQTDGQRVEERWSWWESGSGNITSILLVEGCFSRFGLGPKKQIKFIHNAEIFNAHFFPSLLRCPWTFLHILLNLTPCDTFRGTETLNLSQAYLPNNSQIHSIEAKFKIQWNAWKQKCEGC